jgi:tetratricopeptide (TPR) repeat protein
MQASFPKWLNKIRKKDSGLPSIPVDMDNDRGILKREDSLLLLRSLAPRLEKTPAQELNSLAERLGDQQQALILAARYLAKFGRASIPQYLAEIEKAGSGLSEPLQNWAKGQPLEHSHDLAAATVTAMQALQNDLFCVRAFAAAGFCAPGMAIPLVLMRIAVDCEEKRQSALVHSLEKLYQFGLLEPVNQEPLIPAELIDIARLTAPEAESILSRLVEAMIQLGKPGVETSPSESTWVHFQPAADWAERMNLEPAGKLWNVLGNHFFMIGEQKRAQECLEHALSLEERNFGLEHPDLVTVLNNLGHLRSDAGNFAGAKTCFERALAIDEKNFTPDYPAVAGDANNLGQVLYNLGDLEGAKACFERALMIHEKAFGYGPHHPTVATECLHLGRVLRHMGDLDGAIQFYERALLINEWVYGFQHSSIADSCGQLGKALQAKGDLAKAKACFERQLGIEEGLNGPEHTSVAITLNNLGLTLQDMGELTAAREYFERALKIDEQSFGKEHPTVARDLNNLGCITRELGNLPEASIMFKQALAISDQAEDTRWRDISTAANNLGRVLYSLDDLNGAKDCFLRVLAIDKKIYGGDAAEVATDLTNLGTVYLELDDLPAAKSSYERALEILSKILPATHQKVVTLQRYVTRLNKVL